MTNKQDSCKSESNTRTRIVLRKCLRESAAHSVSDASLSLLSAVARNVSISSERVKKTEMIGEINRIVGTRCTFNTDDPPAQTDLMHRWISSRKFSLHLSRNWPTCRRLAASIHRRPKRLPDRPCISMHLVGAQHVH